MSTLKATYLQQASSASPNITLDASTNATVAGTLAMGYSFKRNKIINGDMRIDQRNAGASVTPTDGQYTLDRFVVRQTTASKFSVQQNAGSVTPPAGFSNYLGVTSLSAYSVASGDIFQVGQNIEGLNISDLAWGTANAKTVTLSFQVYSSLTGTFGGCLSNGANTRSYPFSYSISSANTWTSVSITIPGDTTGTWLTTNSTGIQVKFGIGVGSSYSGTAGAWVANGLNSATGSVSVVGTNGATFYITGVQLETGSIATPYERQIYSDQLAQCQRYYAKLTSLSGNYVGFGSGECDTTGIALVYVKYPITMRTYPTMTQSNTAIFSGGNSFTTSSLGTGYYGSDSLSINVNVTGTMTVGRGCILLGNNNSSAYIDLTAEL